MTDSQAKFFAIAVIQTLEMQLAPKEYAQEHVANSFEIAYVADHALLFYVHDLGPGKVVYKPGYVRWAY